MKSLIKNINKFLLEKYPLLWNTRLIWILLLSGVIHIIFYTFGRLAFSNTSLLHIYNAKELYIKNGTIWFSLLISILVLVVWLIYLFRNNAFKNFYPVKKIQLFLSFLIYFSIILSSTTYFLSYIKGYKDFVNNNYPDSTINEQTDTFNLAWAFLSFNQNDYTIDNKRFPAPFDSLYCEKKEDNINFNAPYLKRFNDEFQFYSLKTVKVKQDPNFQTRTSMTEEGYINSYSKDTIDYYVYKDNVVDVSGLVNTTPTYYNYSNIIFAPDNMNFHEDQQYIGKNLSEKGILLNRRIFELLKRNNPNEIKKVLSDLLSFAVRHKVATNLSLENWYQLIYYPGAFPVRHFIFNDSKKWKKNFAEDSVVATAAEDEVADAVAVVPPEDPALSQSIPEKEAFYRENITAYYLDGTAFATVFNNIREIKEYDFQEILFITLWLSFGLASILFAFRITGLKAVLFSGITAGVISIAIVLLVMLLKLDSNDDEYRVAYLVLAVSTIILTIPVFFLKKFTKMIQSIFINMALVGFVLYPLLILIIINLYQKDNLRQKYGYNYPYKQTILEQLGANTNYVLLATGLVFLLLYSTVLKKWQALAEK